MNNKTNMICPLLKAKCAGAECISFETEIDSNRQLSRDEGKWLYSKCVTLAAPYEIILNRKQLS